MKKYLILTLAFFTLLSCEEEMYIPKPPTYLRIDLPNHDYENYQSDCSYEFNLSKVYTIEDVPDEEVSSCNKRVDLGPLNGMAFLRYWKIEEPLAYYINNANDEIDRHKIKATNIVDKRIIRSEDRVFGTVFELQGDVATPYQFYLTDSTNHFIYCEVLFNSTPNYDSLKPSLEYFRADLDELIQSFKWQE